MTEVETAATSTITGADLHAFIESQREAGEKLYGVVDAARDKELAFEGALRYGWKLQWLFSEDTDQQMSSVAPYLVPITFESRYPYKESDYLDKWAERLGTCAGFLLLTTCAPDRLRQHLQWIFDVQDEAGDRSYFRYYDPRILRAFLPTCTQEQARQFFGPLRRIIVESRDSGTAMCCRPGDDGVQCDEVPITQGLRDTQPGEQSI